jgi:hypothetical protein
MDCLRNFSLTIDAFNNYTAASGDFTVWGAPLNFSIVDTRSSIFDIQGFKNINIFGVDMIGNISSAYGPSPRTLNANVKDFEINVLLNGDIPLPIGLIGATNTFPIILNNTAVQQSSLLSKYKPFVKFESPVQSVKSITLQNLKIFGDHVQNAGQVNMGYTLQFVFYYQYEGED